MRQPLFYLIIFFAGIIAQFGYAKYFSPFGLAPNLVLILTVFVGLSRGSLAGQLLGFAWGLSWDVLSVTLFGSNSFLLTCLGYLSGRLSRKWDESKIVPQVIITGIGSVMFWFGMAVLYEVFAPVSVRFKMNSIVFFQPLYNMLVAPIVFGAAGALVRSLDIEPEY